MAAGAFVLAAVSIVATKANKKFIGFKTAYASFSVTGFSGVATLSGSTTNYFTTTNNTHALYVRVYTSSGLTIDAQQMRTKSNSALIYYK